MGELNRIEKQYELIVDIPFNGTPDLLVENMGRINYGARINDNTKGIISPVLINDLEVTGNWLMTELPLSEVPDLATFTTQPANVNLPTF